jgi:hypothetical protein
MAFVLVSLSENEGTHWTGETRTDLPVTRNLSSGELNTVLRKKVSKPPTKGAGEQVINSHSEDFGQDEKLQIRYAPLLVFEAGD